jgi:hypothetical protein
MAVAVGILIYGDYLEVGCKLFCHAGQRKGSSYEYLCLGKGKVVPVLN